MVTTATKKPTQTKSAELPKTLVAGKVPQLRPGKYADGMPLHDVKYLAVSSS
jgi:hypothetical protein